MKTMSIDDTSPHIRRAGRGPAPPKGSPLPSEWLDIALGGLEGMRCPNLTGAHGLPRRSRPTIALCTQRTSTSKEIIVRSPTSARWETNKERVHNRVIDQWPA